MCLAVPMKVIEVHDNSARVEVGGTQRKIGLDIIDPKPNVGDYVIVHAGFAISVIDEDQARIILKDFEDMLAHESEAY